MAKSTLRGLIFLLLVVVFLLAPFILPRDNTSSIAADATGGSDAIDLDFHSSKSTRSVGGSRSYSSGN